MTGIESYARLPIAFIGGGNMGRALIEGVVNAGHDPAHLRVTDAIRDKAEELSRTLGIAAPANNVDAVRDAEVVVLAVKPQTMQEVVSELSGTLAPSATVISIAAGLGLGALRTWLGPGPSLVRAMPNTPAQIGRGITGLFADTDASLARNHADYLLGAVGEIVWLNNENEFHGLTALSGSGPAYLFALAEAMIKVGQDLGFDCATSSKLVTCTLMGASELLVDGDVDAATLRERVTSPGGTTAAALAEFHRGGFYDLVAAAISAASERSDALGREIEGA